MSTSLTSFPALLGLLVLIGLLVWVAVAARGRARLLAVVGVGLELAGILATFLLGLALPALRDAADLSVPAVVLLLNATSTLFSTAGIALLVLAVVTGSRTPAATRR